jgi:hypothetical protein
MSASGRKSLSPTTLGSPFGRGHTLYSEDLMYISICLYLVLSNQLRISWTGRRSTEWHEYSHQLLRFPSPTGIVRGDEVVWNPTLEDWNWSRIIWGKCVDSRKQYSVKSSPNLSCQMNFLFGIGCSHSIYTKADKFQGCSSRTWFRLTRIARIPR